MFLRTSDVSRFIRLPDNTLSRLADLPPRDNKRWVASRQISVVRTVAYDLLTAPRGYFGLWFE
jgi:hypothetical protein